MDLIMGGQVKVESGKIPIEGIQSLPLGLSSRRSPRNHHQSSLRHSSHVPNLTGSRGAAAHSPVSSGGSSDDCQEHSRSEPASNNHMVPTHSRHPPCERLSKSRQNNSRTPQMSETNLPIAEIHFGEAPVKGKTWSSGSGQYLNLSFPKTTFPLPVRVALTPNGYSADGKGCDTPSRTRSREKVTTNARTTASRGSNRCATPKGLYTERGNPAHRRVLSETTTTTNCGGALTKKLSERTSASMGALNSKVHS